MSNRFYLLLEHIILFCLFRRLFRRWNVFFSSRFFTRSIFDPFDAWLRNVSTWLCLYLSQQSACRGYLSATIPFGTINYAIGGGCRREPYHAGEVGCGGCWREPYRAGRFIIQWAVRVGWNLAVRGDIFPNEGGCWREPYHAWINIQSAVGVGAHHTMRGELSSNG